MMTSLWRLNYVGILCLNHIRSFSGVPLFSFFVVETMFFFADISVFVVL